MCTCYKETETDFTKKWLNRGKNHRRVFYKLYKVIKNSKGKIFLQPPVQGGEFIPFGTKIIISNRKKRIPSIANNPSLLSNSEKRFCRVNFAIHVYNYHDFYVFPEEICIPVYGYSRNFIASDVDCSTFEQIEIPKVSWRKVEKWAKANYL
jgi:hypothetical protein